jgi:hypothetical protein
VMSVAPRRQGNFMQNDDVGRRLFIPTYVHMYIQKVCMLFASQLLAAHTNITKSTFDD